ncbi:MAG: acetyl-CoA carboxylase biotin carboxyl carrier protein [Candidatus Zixiibacteriota bacterium]
MRESKIRKLIKLVEESDIEELEVSSWGRKVRITKKMNRQQNPPPEGNVENTRTITLPEKKETKPPPVQETDNLVPIKSPMVGTFYRAPAPDAKPYVDLNQMIAVGQVVCIVEAMKLMNEIESEVAGRVAKVLVENGKPVEFGQTLFLIEPSN